MTEPRPRGVDRAPIDLSIVVPLRNAAQDIRALWSDLDAALNAHGWTSEVIFVDDASTDSTASVVRELAAGDRRVRLVRLAAEAGTAAALDAGYARVRGRMVVTMDADLRDEPTAIGALVAQLSHADVAVGRRSFRHQPWRGRASSYVLTAVRDDVTRRPIDDGGSCFHAMRRSCLEDLDLHAGLHRFVSILLRTKGYRVVDVRVGARAETAARRHEGSWRAVWRALLDAYFLRCVLRRRVRYRIEEGGAGG